MCLKFVSRMDVPRYDQLQVKNAVAQDSGMYIYKVFYGAAKAFDGGIVLNVISAPSTHTLYSSSPDHFDPTALSENVGYTMAISEAINTTEIYNSKEVHYRLCCLFSYK